ncbi:MAG TPA: hypothetical protein VJH20_00935 [Candidatus Nanoarchaeia archaeon]|nr:hypothetical protein [Candidatus Nanoarchaeia archaeon]
MVGRLYIFQGRHNPLKLDDVSYRETAEKHLGLELAILRGVAFKALITKVYAEGLVDSDQGKWNHYLSASGNPEERFRKAFRRNPESSEDEQILQILYAASKIRNQDLTIKFCGTERNDWRNATSLIRQARQTNFSLDRAIEKIGNGFMRNVDPYKIDRLAQLCYDIRDEYIFNRLQIKEGENAALIVSDDHELRDLSLRAHNFDVSLIKVKSDGRSLRVKGRLPFNLAPELELLEDQIKLLGPLYGKVLFDGEFDPPTL